MPLVIRPYRDSDYQQFRWLHDRTPPAGHISSAPQPWDEHLDRISEHFVALWVAVENDGRNEGIVGSLALEHVGETSVGPPVPEFIDTAGPTVRVHKMRVAPEVQRRTIGKGMMRTAVAWACEQGYTAMILETTPQQEPAVAFYQSTGFTEVGRSMAGRFELVWFHRSL